MKHLYKKIKSKLAIILLGLSCFLFFENLNAQEFTVTIFDNENQPLEFSTVQSESGIFNGISDSLGQVKIPMMGYSDQLIFSYVGMESLRLPFFELRKRGWKVKLRPALSILPSIVVVGRRDEKPEEIPYQIGIITKGKLEEYNSQTTADALAQHENVFIQKSQQGGGSINIRGFEANKVLMVVDGVRMNNIIYRSGHLQDAIKVDNNSLEQIEVIYGPGSLNYGSDALGGVVQFRTKDPKLYDGEDPSRNYNSQSNAMTRFSTANLETTYHADVNYGTEKWASFTSFSFANYEDLRAGSKRPEAYPDFGLRYDFVERPSDSRKDLNYATLDSNVQTPTGFAQFDFLQKIKYKPNNNQTWLLNAQVSTSSNVPRYDILTEQNGDQLKWSDWHYGPQNRMMISLKSQTFKRTRLFNKMTVIGAFQKIDEDRIKRRYFNPWETINREDVYASSLTADFQKNFGPSAALIYGFDGNYNFLSSTAEQLNINTEERRGGVPTRYPSAGSEMTILASYANLTMRSRDSVFTGFGGLRFTYTNLFGRYLEFAEDKFRFPRYFYDTGIGSINTGLTWSIGGIINTKNGWQVKASASTAFHAPNIDDFAKYRDKNQKIRVPNDTLKPERTINSELTIGKAFGRANGNGVKIEATAYYTFLRDGIIIDDFFLNGEPLHLDPVSRKQFKVVASVNKEQGRIYGTSGSFTAKINKFENFYNAGYTLGRIIEGGVDVGPLDHIPPLFARGGLRYKTEKMQLSIVVRHNGWKRIEDYADGEDNQEFATPDGTYAWTTYNFYSSFKLGKRFSVDASVENIGDIHYRTFSSGVSAPGRNFIVALRGKF